MIDKLGVSNEKVIEITYLFALEKPKPTHSMPQEEWISTIKALNHSKEYIPHSNNDNLNILVIVMNEKEKTYIVGFFNGDLKVFNKHDHSELLEVKKLH